MQYFFVPIQNCGLRDFEEFTFSNGVRVTQTPPPWDGDAHLRDACSPNELIHLEAAGGFVLAESEETIGDLTHEAFSESIRRETENCRTVWSVITAIHLSGARENDYWRSGNNIYAAAVYKLNSRLPFAAFRCRHLFQVRFTNIEPLAWTMDRLMLADQIAKGFGAAQAVPEINSALNFWIAANNVDLYEWPVRISLLVTCLEALTVRRSERAYAWDAVPRQRLQGRSSLVDADSDFWNKLNILRNDVVHRAGLPKDPNASPQIGKTLRLLEDLVRNCLSKVIVNAASPSSANVAGLAPIESV